MPPLLQEKEEAVKGQDFENAAKLRDEEKSKREAMEARKKEWADQQTQARTVLSPRTILQPLSPAGPVFRLLS